MLLQKLLTLTGYVLYFWCCEIKYSLH